METMETLNMKQVEADIERTKALTKEVEASTELKKLQAEMQRVQIEVLKKDNSIK